MEVDFIVSINENMILLEVGLRQLKHSSSTQCIFSIFEPIVHWSILNYLSNTKILETLLKEQMVDSMWDPNAMGKLWKKLFTFYVARLFNGTNFLADMCCFKGVELANLH